MLAGSQCQSIMAGTHGAAAPEDAWARLFSVWQTDTRKGKPELRADLTSKAGNLLPQLGPTS